jgi:hypothetical protein
METFSANFQKFEKVWAHHIILETCINGWRKYTNTLCLQCIYTVRRITYLYVHSYSRKKRESTIRTYVTKKIAFSLKKSAMHYMLYFLQSKINVNNL